MIPASGSDAKEMGWYCHEDQECRRIRIRMGKRTIQDGVGFYSGEGCREVSFY